MGQKEAAGEIAAEQVVAKEGRKMRVTGVKREKERAQMEER